MIRFSAALVGAGLGLLLAGAITSELPLVYAAIAVSVGAALTLTAGVIVGRDEILGKASGSPDRRVSPGPLGDERARAAAPDEAPGLPAAFAFQARQPGAAEPADEPSAAAPLSGAEPAATSSTSTGLGWPSGSSPADEVWARVDAELSAASSAATAPRLSKTSSPEELWNRIEQELTRPAPWRSGPQDTPRGLAGPDRAEAEPAGAQEPSFGPEEAPFTVDKPALSSEGSWAWSPATSTFSYEEPADATLAEPDEPPAPGPAAWEPAGTGLEAPEPAVSPSDDADQAGEAPASPLRPVWPWDAAQTDWPASPPEAAPAAASAAEIAVPEPAGAGTGTAEEIIQHAPGDLDSGEDAVAEDADAEAAAGQDEQAADTGADEDASPDDATAAGPATDEAETDEATNATEAAGPGTVTGATPSTSESTDTTPEPPEEPAEPETELTEPEAEPAESTAGPADPETGPADPETETPLAEPTAGFNKPQHEAGPAEPTAGVEQPGGDVTSSAFTGALLSAPVIADTTASPGRPFSLVRPAADIGGAAPDTGASAHDDLIRPTPRTPQSGRFGHVLVVPGVARYHRRGCILIRFLSEADIESIPRAQAEAEGCVPCKACQIPEPRPRAD